MCMLINSQGSDSEVELSSLCKENKGSTVKAFAIVRGEACNAIKVYIYIYNIHNNFLHLHACLQDII